MHSTPRPRNQRGTMHNYDPRAWSAYANVVLVLQYKDWEKLAIHVKLNAQNHTTFYVFIVLLNVWITTT